MSRAGRQPVAEARRVMRKLTSPAPALFAAISQAERMLVLTWGVPMADFSPFGGLSYAPEASVSGADSRPGRAAAPAAPRRELRRPVAPDASPAAGTAVAAPSGQGAEAAAAAAPPVFSFRGRPKPLGAETSRREDKREAEPPVSQRMAGRQPSPETALGDFSGSAGLEPVARAGAGAREGPAGFWADIAAPSVDAWLKRGPAPSAADTNDVLRPAPRIAPGVQVVSSGARDVPVSPRMTASPDSESAEALSLIGRVASEILSAKPGPAQARSEAESFSVRLTARELHEGIRSAVDSPPAHTPAPPQPQALEAEEIAALVNEVLAGQARRHGVDLS